MDSARLDPASARPSVSGQETTSIDFAPNAGPAPERTRPPRKLVLCFDGTGNKFHGDDSDSNILKIFRMLDREAEDQYHYYQRKLNTHTHRHMRTPSYPRRHANRLPAGIGTYVASASLSHTGLKSRISSWYQKAKDSAIGSSFDQHVVGGYRFLMRFYSPGDEIYMFGFSRGAYIARFLAEMLDYIGLLSHGNEEMVKFAWKAFSQWQCRQGNVDHSDGVNTKMEEKTREMYRFMKGFRETFSRPVGRIKFLGLFDTVNSVPRFETAWMQRSKFPYTARSSARYIRHAVSIDERRAKFRQDLMYQHQPKQKHHPHLHRLGDLLDWHEDTHYRPRADNAKVSETRGRRPSRLEVPERRSGDPKAREGSQYAPYRSRSRSRQSQRPSTRNESDACSVSASVASRRWEDDGAQDIDEVWFSGGHGDVGGGWEALDDRKSASHVPLVWIIREAMRAGLNFDEDKSTDRPANPVDVPRIRVGNGTETPSSPLASPGLEEEKSCSHDGSPSAFHDLMHKAHTARIHDSLAYSSGLGFSAVTAWKFMEWMPFRRMDLKSDGTWEPIRWPLPRGEVRDIPDNVRVHGSVIRRLKSDEKYRPGNLIIGGGGRGVKIAGAQYGIGEWECVAEPGDPIGEIWVRKKKEGALEV
jgi:uncharacterized protein (DUF2235 family)